MEWDWPQPAGTWKVHTDKTLGNIKVKDEQGRILFERKNLSEAVVQMIEEQFLSVVARESKPQEDVMFR
jgi:hypothetical protein